MIWWSRGETPLLLYASENLSEYDAVTAFFVAVFCGSDN